jgi:hypothetical protein
MDGDGPWEARVMRVGLVTPVVNLNPRFDPPAWERDGGIDELGDGWIPFGLEPADLRRLLRAPDVADVIAARGSDFEVVLAPEPPLDPIEDRAGSEATVRTYAELSATALALRFRHRSRAHYLEQLEAMKAVVDDLDDDPAELGPPL